MSTSQVPEVWNRPTEMIPAAEVVASLDDSLRRLGTDHVDVFQLHGVPPAAYRHAIEEIAPALLRERARGKLRHLGLTETAVTPPGRNAAVDRPGRALAAGGRAPVESQPGAGMGEKDEVRDEAARPDSVLPSGWQIVPQAPQLVMLARRSVSHPLAAERSQSAKPGRQAPKPHTPAGSASMPATTSTSRTSCSSARCRISTRCRSATR